jgi:membrane associated rhomboid family serine protease
VIEAYGFTPAYFSILTLFTSMFLHAGIAHLFGNMWFLYIFGDNVEDKFGHFFYLIFYILAGLAATFTHYLTNLGSTIPAVGASGAISGVLGAYIVLFPRVGVYVSGRAGVGKVSALLMIGLWFAFQLISGIFFGESTGVAFFAHIGGFIFGVLGGFIYRAVSK